MNEELKTFLVKTGVWLTGGVGFLVAVWFLVSALIATIQLKQPDQGSVVSAPAKELRKAPTKRVATAPVRAYDAGTKLKLPADVVANPDQQVIAATQVKGTDRPQTVTTVLDTRTGDATQYVRQDPLPWIALETRGAARLALGYRYDGSGFVKQVVRMSVEQDILRVKALTAGAVGSVDSDGHAFLGVGIAYRW